jgi:aspartate aminotransferase
MIKSPVQSMTVDPPAAPRQGLSLMASTLVGSEILRIAGEVRALRETGRPVLDLTVGDFSPKQFRIPKALEQAIARALAAGETNYPPSDGVPALRKAVQSFYAHAFGLDYPLEGILIAGGARPLIWATYSAILDPQDTVVYPVPSWNNNHYCHLVGARGVAVDTRAENGFLPTADELAPHLSGAAMLVLNSPLNPAGTGFRREQLAAIARLVVDENRRRGAHEKPLFLLYDQIYWLIASPDAPHSTPVELEPAVAPYTVMIDGISKAFAATGLRVGWVTAPPFSSPACATCSVTWEPGRPGPSRWRPPRSSPMRPMRSCSPLRCATASACASTRSTVASARLPRRVCRCVTFRRPARSTSRCTST